MKIVVEVTREELSEFIDEEHMRECIIEDLDNGREYPGFNVKIIITGEQ